ncbi:MAG: hypothetical protein WAK13_00510, partial [Terriglobales bacterium]
MIAVTAPSAVFFYDFRMFAGPTVGGSMLANNSIPRDVSTPQNISAEKVAQSKRDRCGWFQPSAG